MVYTMHPLTTLVPPINRSLAMGKFILCGSLCSHAYNIVLSRVQPNPPQCLQLQLLSSNMYFVFLLCSPVDDFCFLCWHLSQTVAINSHSEGWQQNQHERCILTINPSNFNIQYFSYENFHLKEALWSFHLAYVNCNYHY